MTQPQSAKRSEHPIAVAVRAATAGAPPPVDGAWDRVAAWNDSAYGVVAFTGHAMISAPSAISDHELNALGANGFGGAHDPRIITAMMAAINGPSTAHTLDGMYVAAGLPGEPQLLVRREDLDDAPRVRYAAAFREGVAAYGLESGAQIVLSVGRGIGGLTEIGFEVMPQARGRGLAQAVVADARHLGAPQDVVVASVAPGNVASVRVVTAAGFTLVGSNQVLALS